MNDEDRAKIVTNYYRASGALLEIGRIKNIPDELLQLTIMASKATENIINYINSHRE